MQTQRRAIGIRGRPELRQRRVDKALRREKA
jgi:hypothetical protein